MQVEMRLMPDGEWAELLDLIHLNEELQKKVVETLLGYWQPCDGEPTAFTDEDFENPNPERVIVCCSGDWEVRLNS